MRSLARIFARNAPEIAATNNESTAERVTHRCECRMFGRPVLSGKVRTKAQCAEANSFQATFNDCLQDVSLVRPDLVCGSVVRTRTPDLNKCTPGGRDCVKAYELGDYCSRLPGGLKGQKHAI